MLQIEDPIFNPNPKGFCFFRSLFYDGFSVDSKNPPHYKGSFSIY